MLIKSLLAASTAVLASTTSAFAFSPQSWDNPWGPSADIGRGAPSVIRSCSGTFVGDCIEFCYNQVTPVNASFSISENKVQVIRLFCLRFTPNLF